MRHSIITFIGYTIAIAWAIFVGMIIGIIIDEELVRHRSAPTHKHTPAGEQVLSPEVFEGIAWFPYESNRPIV